MRKVLVLSILLAVLSSRAGDKDLDLAVNTINTLGLELLAKSAKWQKCFTKPFSHWMKTARSLPALPRLA
jgi:hypothetical protein